MKIAISHLFEKPDYFPFVAEKIHNEWWSDKPGHSPMTMETRLRTANDPNQIPLSLLAMVDNAPAGTINLVENDNEARPDLYPWLAALLVFPEFRALGIGSILVRSLITHGQRLKLNEMYLGTDIPEYYHQFGAKNYDQLESGLFIMKIDL